MRVNSTTQNRFEIVSDWIDTPNSISEERTTFCYLGLKINDLWLTRGHDLFNDRETNAPVLSAYYLAEWFAWNWWQLRWEPYRDSHDWSFTHKIASIGHGFIWPDIEFASEGNRIRLVVRKTPGTPTNSYTYVTDFTGHIDANHFENVIEFFIQKVITRLEESDIKTSNLHNIWAALQAEFNDPKLAEARKLESLFGERGIVE